jgi:hypothetical protein
VQQGQEDVGDDTPTFMPPPPDTPGSLANTPSFESIQRSEVSMGRFLPDVLSMQESKRPRTDY